MLGAKGPFEWGKRPTVGLLPQVNVVLAKGIVSAVVGRGKEGCRVPHAMPVQCQLAMNTG